MKKEKHIHLPGSDYQLGFVLGNVKVVEKNILVIGSGSEEIAKTFLQEGADNVELIVQDYESMMNSNLMLADYEKITAKIMEFEFTDYDDNSFDLIYAQASISSERRNKILKEIKRILKPNGILAVGEIVKLKKDVPTFVKEIFDSSDLAPLFIDDIESFYIQRGWRVINKQDYSKSLKEYYSVNLKKLSGSVEELTDKEKSYYKKLINRISHQSKAYLKQGGDEYIGFISVLLKSMYTTR